MKKLKTDKFNLKKLLKTIKDEDKDELKHSFGKDYAKKFLKICFKASEKYFYGDDCSNPIAIGGVEPFLKDNLKIGQIWLISSKNFTEQNIELFKYINSKINEFKKEYDVLYNIIYKSNFKALKWLSRCGFKILDTECDDYKLFYYAKGGINFDLRYITGK